jgi:hypothetical protein
MEYADLVVEYGEDDLPSLSPVFQTQEELSEIWKVAQAFKEDLIHSPMVGTLETCGSVRLNQDLFVIEDGLGVVGPFNTTPRGYQERTTL